MPTKMPTLAFIILLLFSLSFSWGQQKTKKIPDSLSTLGVLDSLLIDRNPKNYSFRIFGNFKTQQFSFNSEFNKVRYIPNNRYGIGFGFANKKLVIDIAFNLKSRRKEPTERFNLRINYTLRKHYVDFYFQYYKGFNVSDEDRILEPQFRNDLRSIASGVNYLFLFNEDSYSTGALRNVITDANKSDFSFGVGGFAVYLDQKGDANILEANPNFDENIKEINSLSGFGLGVLAGTGGFFAMNKYFYSSVSVNGGIGLMQKEVNHNHNNTFRSPVIYQLAATGVLGYVRKKYYLNFSVEMAYYSTEMIRNINEVINVAQAKLAFGYKILK